MTWVSREYMGQIDAEAFAREMQPVVDGLASKLSEVTSSAQSLLAQPIRLPSLDALVGPAVSGAGASGAAGAGLTPSLAGGPSPDAPAPATAGPTNASPFTLPSIDSFLPRADAGTAPRPTPHGAGVPGVPSLAASVPSAAGFGAPSPENVPGYPEGSGALRATPLGAPAPTLERGSDLRAYARQAAVRNGISPDIFERQIAQESGFNPRAVSPVGAQGIAQFMPATARGVGLADPFEPYAALDAAAAHMRANLDANQGDYATALAAYNAGQGNVNRYGGVPPFAETRHYIDAILGADRPTRTPAAAVTNATQRPSTDTAQPEPTGAPGWGTYTPETLTPNQFAEGQAQGLSPAEAVAVCGPAAAVAFARANGRTPTLREAKELAASLGLWDVNVGMYGPASQVRLLENMGVPSALEQGADWGRIAQEVQAGRPVIVDTPQHYYTVTGYDPQTGQFEFGQSAGVLTASRGRTRWRPEELPSLGMGAPRASIYLTQGR